MRQVPEPDPAPCGIGGDGRIARHFRHCFFPLSPSVRTWCRRVPDLSVAGRLGILSGDPRIAHAMSPREGL